MQYNLSTHLDRERFKARVATLLQKGVVVEMTEKAFRTTNQNSYLHLIIGVVAMETGVTLEYAKQEYFKLLCNKDLFVLYKADKYAGQVKTIRSSAELTKEEMSMAIDRFKRWASQQGMYIPNPGDEELLKDIAIEMGRNKNYLY